MRLEPVYLLAPEPKPAPQPQFGRRALLVAAVGGFALGAVTGTTGMVWGATERPTSRTDESMAWALELQDGPIEALISGADAFLARHIAFADPRLDTGVLRLGSALADESLVIEDRRELAKKLIAVIQGSDTSSSRLRELLPSLRAVR